MTFSEGNVLEGPFIAMESESARPHTIVNLCFFLMADWDAFFSTGLHSIATFTSILHKSAASLVANHLFLLEMLPQETEVLEKVTYAKDIATMSFLCFADC